MIFTVLRMECWTDINCKQCIPDAWYYLARIEVRQPSFDGHHFYQFSPRENWWRWYLWLFGQPVVIEIIPWTQTKPPYFNGNTYKIMVITLHKRALGTQQLRSYRLLCRVFTKSPLKRNQMEWRKQRFIWSPTPTLKTPPKISYCRRTCTILEILLDKGVWVAIGQRMIWTTKVVLDFERPLRYF